MGSDIQMYSIMNIEKLENRVHLFYLINYIYKDYLKKQNGYIADICVVASPGELRGQGSFNTGDIFFKIEFNDVYNGPDHEYVKGVITQSPNSEYKVSWILNEDIKYFIPIGIYEAMNINLTIAKSDDMLYNYKNEILSGELDENFAAWISFIDFVLKEDKYNTTYADSINAKQKSFNQAFIDDQSHSIKTVKIPVKDKDSGESKVIDSNMFLN